MKSAAIESKQYPCTDLKPVFAAIGQVQKSYNWLVTNIDCLLNDEIYQKRFHEKDYFWISGEALTELVHAKNPLWVWGVFSGFSKDIPLKQILQHDLPYADENPNFWIHNVTLQHPLSEIEIVAWDAMMTLFISRDDSLADSFINTFEHAYDLQEDNRRVNAGLRHIKHVILQKGTEQMKAVLDEKRDLEWRIWHEMKCCKTPPDDHKILQSAAVFARQIAAYRQKEAAAGK